MDVDPPVQQNPTPPHDDHVATVNRVTEDLTLLAVEPGSVYLK